MHQQTVEPERRTLQISDRARELLENWAGWCMSGYFPSEFAVGCDSAESIASGRLGNIHLTATELLQQSIRDGSGSPYNEPQAVAVELAVLRLPDKQRLAVRLHFVAWRRIPMNRKFRLLGVGELGYFDLVEAGVRQIEKTVS